MIIYSTADVHSPEYLQLFREALENTRQEPDLFLFAGDMVERNKVLMYKPVIELVLKKYPNTKIIAVFGNEEFRGYEKLYMQIYKEITWLNDNYVSLLDGELCIIGTRGGLDKPTTWQSKNLPGIEKYYIELPFKVERLALELRRNNCKRIILLSHYGVTYKNLVGEDTNAYPYLACSRFEKVLRREIIDMVIHGHIHLGQYELVYVKDIPVYNVSLPARRKIVEIKI